MNRYRHFSIVLSLLVLIGPGVPAMRSVPAYASGLGEHRPSIARVVSDHLAPPQSPLASSDPFTVATHLIPTWTTGILSDGVGPSKIVVADINQDGTTDVVTCSLDYAYVLNATGVETYDTTWYSEQIACKKVTAADRDADGVWEIYVATTDGQVLIFAGDSFQALGAFTLPAGNAASDIEVADVDGDGGQEIILARADATLVYNANTLALEWHASGLGGEQLGIGNIDNDSQLEIVVNGNPAHVLNASLKLEKWAYSGGFGVEMGLGDVDGDNRDEIAYIDSWANAYVFEGDTLTVKWSRNDLGDLNAVAVADVDGNGAGEVLVGNGQWGSVTGYQGNTGTQLWSIPNPEHGVFGIGVGDADNDGVQEVLWGAGLSSTGKDALFIGSWVSETVEWSSDDLDGPFYVASQDVDNDGQTEIVLATQSTNSDYVGGTLRVYDGATRQLEWSTTIASSFFDIYQLAIGQLDGDSALEILVGGNHWYDTRLQAYDGISQTVDWQSPVLASGEPRALTIANVDADAMDEIIVALSNQHVQVFNGASSFIQWDSNSLDSTIQDLALGDLDGDAVLDLAVLTYQSVYVFEVGTWTPKLHQALADGQQVAIANSDLLGSGELLLFTSGGGSNNWLQAWDGVTYGTLWRRSLGNVVVTDLAVADLDPDGVQELVVTGSAGFDWDSPSLLWIGAQAYPLFWEYRMNNHWGYLTGVAVSDVDNDEQLELLLGSSALIQVNEIVTASVVVQQTYLPVTSRPKPPRGLYGTVTENGVPAAGVSLDLRFYNGSSWSTAAITTTAADGSYSFTNISSLSPGQYYYVRFQNTAGGNSNRLWTWHTRSVSTYVPGSEFNIGNFDLANIALVSPAPGATVNVPRTFQWTPRPASPTDSYEFNLYDPYDLNPYFFTDPPLGYVGSYTLNGPLPGFGVGPLYVWELWVYSPDGGYGISYEARVVYFANTGLASSEGLDLPQPVRRPGDVQRHPPPDAPPQPGH